MSKLHRIILTVAATAWPLSPAGAQQIPLQVLWSGDSPTVLVQEPGGPAPLLDRDDTARIIRGALPVGNQTITVQYGDFNLPFGLRVSQSLPRVSLMINHSRRKYCTERLIREVEAQAATLPDAINRFVAAGQLLAIPDDRGGCDSELRIRAMVARGDRNQQMWAFNRSLYIPNSEFAAQATWGRNVLRRSHMKQTLVQKVSGGG